MMKKWLNTEKFFKKYKKIGKVKKKLPSMLLPFKKSNQRRRSKLK